MLVDIPEKIKKILSWNSGENLKKTFNKATYCPKLLICCHRNQLSHTKMNAHVLGHTEDFNAQYVKH